MSKPLGRAIPPDFHHVEKYALNALDTAARPKRVPVAVGSNWYTGMDTPQLASDGTYWIGKSRMGTVRGGHCYCLEPAGRSERDESSWWAFYDQGQEGACEGFGHSRMMSLLNRKRYDAFWLYDQARILDGQPSEEGTTNRAALEVLRTRGHVVVHARQNTADRHGTPDLAEGISAYRWAITVDEILTALGTPTADHVVLLNSWGTQWPHRVSMPATTLERLMREQGEAGVVTDK